MHFHLIFLAIFCFTIITSVECKSYIFTGHEWKNEMEKCWSGGEGRERESYTLETLDSVGLKYEDINPKSRVTAYGNFTGSTFNGHWSVSSIALQIYQEGKNYKKFFVDWGYTDTQGWATQMVKIQLSVEFWDHERVMLYNDVSAGSWLAFSCAKTTSYGNKLELINDDPM